MRIENRIAEMGLSLPSLPMKSGVRRVRAVRSGSLVFLAGHGPFSDGGYPFKGPVPTAISIAEAREATRFNALALLSTLKAEIGDLDRVTRILKLTAFVNAEPGFNEASKVAEGCSDLLIDLYGDRGRHARSAISVVGLSLGICCEVEGVVEVADEAWPT